MTLLQQLVIIFILYLCVYALISRVCKCIEHCATARAYSKFTENGGRFKTFADVVKEMGILASTMENGGTEYNVEEKTDKE